MYQASRAQVYAAHKGSSCSQTMALPINTSFRGQTMGFVLTICEYVAVVVVWRHPLYVLEVRITVNSLVCTVALSYTFSWARRVTHVSGHTATAQQLGLAALECDQFHQSCVENNILMRKQRRCPAPTRCAYSSTPVRIYDVKSCTCLYICVSMLPLLTDRVLATTLLTRLLGLELHCSKN